MADTAVTKPRILDAQEAADYIGRSLNFVRRTLRYECPVVQHGYRGPLGFFETDLDRWLAKHTQEPVG
jgi:hypothetical protein